MVDNSKHPNGSIQAVIFDLDGVLVDSEWLAFEVWQDIARGLGGTLPNSAFPKLTGTSAEESARQVMLATGLTFDVDRYVALAWQGVVDRLKTEIAPIPGARALVNALAARGIPLAIASNSLTWYINDALHSLKMEADFPIRVSIDHVAEGKPAPDVYLEAARQLGVSPEYCLAVEDSLVGLQSALAAGMRVIAVPHEMVGKNGFEQAWRVYSSLEEAVQELPEILGW